MRLFNPWKRVRELEQKLEELEYRIEYAEEIAWRKSKIEFDAHTQHLQKYNTTLLERLTQITKMNNYTPVIFKE